MFDLKYLVHPASICPVSGQTLVEEIFNALTHGLGLALSVAGTVILIYNATIYGNFWHVLSCSIYGGTLVMLYAASTFYHTARSVRRKRIFQTLDHACIYWLIAGTYTPFTMITLRGGWGWSLFSVVWACAITGALLKIFHAGRSQLLSTIAYLAMGWLAVIAIIPLKNNLPLGGLIWIFLGGLAYSFGTIFYLKQGLRFNHAVWHVFVLAGSVCHYFAILFYVLPS